MAQCMRRCCPLFADAHVSDPHSAHVAGPRAQLAALVLQFAEELRGGRGGGESLGDLPQGPAGLRGHGPGSGDALAEPGVCAARAWPGAMGGKAAGGGGRAGVHSVDPMAVTYNSPACLRRLANTPDRRAPTNEASAAWARLAVVEWPTKAGGIAVCRNVAETVHSLCARSGSSQRATRRWL